MEAAHQLQQRNAEDLEAAQKLAEQEKALALERQKRFNLLNTQFRKKEAGFNKEIQAVQSKVDEREQLVVSLQAECRMHNQVIDNHKLFFHIQLGIFSARLSLILIFW